MRNNLHRVNICNAAGHLLEATSLRINDPIAPGKTVVAMRDKPSLPKLRLCIVRVEGAIVIARKVKK